MNSRGTLPEGAELGEAKRPQRQGRSEVETEQGLRQLVNVPTVGFPLQDEVHLVILTPEHLQQLAPEPLCLPGLPNATTAFFLFSPLLLITMFCKGPGRILSLRRSLFPGKKQNKKSW